MSLRLFHRQDGISLVVAVAILSVLTVSGATLVRYSGANARSAEYSSSGVEAGALAEAGINYGLSILNNAPNPMNPNLLPPQTVTLEGGETTFSGSLSGETWTITATGSTANPTGPGVAEVGRTLTAVAEVTGIVPGASPEYWNRFYHHSDGSCLEIDTVEIPSSVASRGDICLKGPAKITGASSIVEAGDEVILEAPSSIGTNGNPILEARVGGPCEWKGSGARGSPCSSLHHVYAQTYTTTPDKLIFPDLDLAYWYENAAPGPKNPCTIGSYPHGFDNDSIYNNSRPGGSNVDSNGRRYAEVTHKDLSYTCKSLDSDGNLIGEISWNHMTGVLTIEGSIFIDGDVRFDDDGQLVNYQGRGIIFAAGDVEYDEVVCAGGDGTFDCWQNNMSNWDPDQNMLILLSGGDSEYDQGKTMPRQPAALQGVLYAKGDCTIHQFFKLSGPVICDKIVLPFNEAWPVFYPWPPLGSLINAQIYGNAATATEHEVVVVAQYG